MSVVMSSHARSRARRRIPSVPVPRDLILRFGGTARTGSIFKAIKDGVIFVCKVRTNYVLIITVYRKEKRMPKKARNYKKEYRDFHGKPEQIKNRAKRNKAHAEAEKDGRIKPGQEVDHKVPLSKGGSNGKSNTRVVSRNTNRKKADKMPSRKGKK